MRLEWQHQSCPTLWMLRAFSTGTTHSKRYAHHGGALNDESMASAQRCLKALRKIRQLQRIAYCSWSFLSLAVNIGNVAAHVAS